MITRTIESSIDIAASPTVVWKILIAFGCYADWNPFMTTVIGAPKEATKLQVTIRPPGRSAMTFKPIVLTVNPERQLTWLGKFLVRGLVDGMHDFRLEAIPSGCRFHQSEKFSGILVPLFGTTMLTATQRGFEGMNLALKERAELRAI